MIKKLKARKAAKIEAEFARRCDLYAKQRAKIFFDNHHVTDYPPRDYDGVYHYYYRCAQSGRS